MSTWAAVYGEVVMSELDAVSREFFFGWIAPATAVISFVLGVWLGMHTRQREWQKAAKSRFVFGVREALDGISAPLRFAEKMSTKVAGLEEFTIFDSRTGEALLLVQINWRDSCCSSRMVSYAMGGVVDHVSIFELGTVLDNAFARLADKYQ